MSGYFSRGASAGGNDEGYFNREDVTGDAGVGSATGGPGGVADADYERDENNPNIVRAISNEPEARLDETAGTNTAERIEGTYPDYIEGSDSPRTGSSFDNNAYLDAPTVETPQ